MHLSSFYWAPDQDLYWPRSCQVRDSGDFLQKNSVPFSPPPQVPSLLSITVPTGVCRQQICRGWGGGGPGIPPLQQWLPPSIQVCLPDSFQMFMSSIGKVPLPQCLQVCLCSPISLGLSFPSSATTLPLPIRFHPNHCWGCCLPLSQRLTRVYNRSGGSSTAVVIAAC